MALDNDINQAFDSNLSCSSDNEDDIDDLYHELYDSLIKAKKEVKSKIVENELILDKIKYLEKLNHDLNLLVEQLLPQIRTHVKC